MLQIAPSTSTSGNASSSRLRASALSWLGLRTLSEAGAGMQAGYRARVEAPVCWSVRGCAPASGGGITRFPCAFHRLASGHPLVLRCHAVLYLPLPGHLLIFLSFTIFSL